MSAPSLSRTTRAPIGSEVMLTEIAFENGFDSAQYFSKVFRKYLGVSPSEFRAGSLDGAVDAFLDLIQAFAKHSASRSITAAAALPNS